MLPVLSSALPSDARRLLADLGDEDPAFAQALRAMLWEAYVEAGCPLGESEDALLAWWAFGQHTTVQ